MILVCLLFCSSVALPSRIIVSKVDFPRTPEPTNVHLDQAMNLNKMNILTGTPTNTRTVRLYNKNGFFLKITNTGKLRGTRSFHGRDSKYERLIIKWKLGVIVYFTVRQCFGFG